MKSLQKILLLVLIASAFSCVRYRNLLILNEKIGVADTTAVPVMEAYKVQKKDLLHISVSSTDASSISIFTKEQSGQRNVSEASLYLNAFVVDDSGYVSMPILGSLKVENKSTYEIRTLIQEQMNTYYKYAVVDVKLVSFRVSILGEVQKGGTFTVFRDKINLLEALALSGGFTDLSKRHEVKIIRFVGDKTEIKVVDFTSEKLINEEWFYVRPNDILYIEPMRVKAIKSNTATISLAMSIITFVIVLVNMTKK